MRGGQLTSMLGLREEAAASRGCGRGSCSDVPSATQHSSTKTQGTPGPADRGLPATFRQGPRECSEPPARCRTGPSLCQGITWRAAEVTKAKAQGWVSPSFLLFSGRLFLSLLLTLAIRPGGRRPRLSGTGRRLGTPGLSRAECTSQGGEPGRGAPAGKICPVLASVACSFEFTWKFLEFSLLPLPTLFGTNVF